MKLAAVINVGHGPAALKYAIDTQKLLLDRLGARLDSIRLAAPRLLRHACASAIAEKPDVLVMAGGPRAARRAGQLAHARGAPVLFLPGYRAAEWARDLWGSLSLEDMVAALARGDVKPVRLGVGTAGHHIFFEQACCGLIPHLPELRGALEEADTFAEGWQVVTRAAQLARFLLTPNVRFGLMDDDLRWASALIIEPAERDAQTGSRREGHPVLKCFAAHYGALGLLGAVMRGRLGCDYQRGRTKPFECASLLVDAGRPGWILLDGDPVRFEGLVEFRFVPEVFQTFIFNPMTRPADDDDRQRPSEFLKLSPDPEPEWNFPATSHVAFSESRGSGHRKH